MIISTAIHSVIPGRYLCAFASYLKAETGQGRQIRFEYGTVEEAPPLHRVFGE